MRTIICLKCGKEAVVKRERKKFCSQKCGAAYRLSLKPKITQHKCRMCGKDFPIGPWQNQKWLCSDTCRRASKAKSVREFHLRHPDRESAYRERTKEKIGPDGNLKRFRKINPTAPMACESCGERRVLDVAHKPKHRRNGAWRSAQNCRWPEQVWILCPTCHALLDRMHYSPEELGLKA